MEVEHSKDNDFKIYNWAKLQKDGTYKTEPSVVVTPRALSEKELKDTSKNGFKRIAFYDEFQHKYPNIPEKQRLSFTAYLWMVKHPLPDNAIDFEIEMRKKAFEEINKALHDKTNFPALMFKETGLYVHVRESTYIELPTEVIQKRFSDSNFFKDIYKIPIIDPSSYTGDGSLASLKTSSNEPFFIREEMPLIESNTIRAVTIDGENITPVIEESKEEEIPPESETLNLPMWEKQIRKILSFFPQLRNTFTSHGESYGGGIASNCKLIAEQILPEKLADVRNRWYNLRFPVGNSVDSVNRVRQEHRLLCHLNKLENCVPDLRSTKPVQVLLDAKYGSRERVFLTTFWSANEGGTFIQEFAPPSLTDSWATFENEFSQENSAFVTKQLFKAFTLLYNSGYYIAECKNVIVLPTEGAHIYRANTATGLSVLHEHNTAFYGDDRPDRERISKFLESNCRLERRKDGLDDFKLLDLNGLGEVNTENHDPILFHEALFLFIKAAEIINYSPDAHEEPNIFSQLVSQFEKSSIEIRDTNNVSYCEEKNEVILQKLQDLGYFNRESTPLPPLTTEEKYLRSFNPLTPQSRRLALANMPQ